MNAARHAVVIAFAMSTVFVGWAAESTGPAPDDVIFPRSNPTNAGSDATDVASLVPAPSLGGVLPTLGYLTAFALLGGGGWYLIKRGALPRPFSKSDGKLRVLETRVLGNRQFLVVAEYGEAKMLLGVCPGRIDYLTPLAGHPLATEEDLQPEHDVGSVGELQLAAQR